MGNQRDIQPPQSSKPTNATAICRPLMKDNFGGAEAPGYNRFNLIDYTTKTNQTTTTTTTNPTDNPPVSDPRQSSSAVSSQPLPTTIDVHHLSQPQPPQPLPSIPESPPPPSTPPPIPNLPLPLVPVRIEEEEVLTSVDLEK